MDTEKKVCGAKTRSGRPCQRAPMLNGRCYLHGGATPKGIASPHYRGKGYSKYFPDSVQTLIGESIVREDLLELREDIAVVNAFIAELSKAYSAGVSQEWVSELTSEFESLIRVLSDTSVSPEERNERFKVGVSKVRALLRRGAETFETIEQITELIDQKRKLVETEVKREIEAGQLIAKADVLIFLHALAQAIRETIPDADLRKRLMHRLEAIYSRAYQGADPHNA